MMRYLPPNGTAGFAMFFVSAPRRLPWPPAKIIAKHSVFLITITPHGIKSNVLRHIVFCTFTNMDIFDTIKADDA